MIIRLKGATFTTNIGTLDSWSIKYTTTNGSVTKKSGATSIKKDDIDGEILVFEFDTAKYTYKSGTIMSNGVSAGTISVSGNTITVNVNAGTTLGGKVEINFVMEAIGGGEPEEPDTPTSYTFTITPDPISATVTLSATGYSTVSGTGSQSITVANGTEVNWSVSADGYATRTGNWTINGSNESKSIKLSEISTEYVSYLGTEHFTDIGQRVQWNESGQKWTDTHSGTTSAGTELIPISSEDSIWINKIAVVNGSLASGGFYDMNKQFVAPLYWRTFGIDQVANAAAKFVTPENPITIASVEEEYNCSIAYVKFTAWAASDVDNTGIETTEARVYYANGVPQEPTYVSYVGEEVFSFNKQSFTNTGYTTSGSDSAYASDYLAVTPEQGVWLQYIFTMSDAHRCIGLFDSNKTFIKSITAADFGLSISGKFQTPSAPVKISSLEGTENVAYVRFVAWTTSDGGRANTEARIYSY